MSSVPAKFTGASFPEGSSEPPLPPIPRAVKYWDDFEEKDRILRFDGPSKEITLHDDGRIFKYDLAPLSEFQSGVVVLITAHLLQSGDPSSAKIWLNQIFVLMGRATPKILSFLADQTPQKVQGVWSGVSASAPFSLFAAERENAHVQMLGSEAPAIQESPG